MRVAVPAERKPFISPVQPDNRPTAVAGDINGLMPARDLVRVAPNCLAARAAGPSLGLLLATARDEGVVLHTEQCYRPLSDQVTVKQRWSAAGHSACAAPVLTTSSGKPKGTSMHGWGEAADLSDAGGTVGFGSPGYEFLTAQAARFGWNHPAWARPGGSTCPEAWHWGWVGDGGILQDSPIRADVVTLLPTWDGLGYSIVTGLGAVLPHGTRPIVDPLPAPDWPGWWSAPLELPVAVGTGWSARTATPSRRRLMMGSLVPLARRTQLVLRPECTPPTAPRQLDLAPDDVRRRGMTPAERQAVLRSLARLLLEAGGVGMWEVGDDNA